MKVKGNESRLVKGKYYFVSDTSDEQAVTLQMKEKWVGEGFTFSGRERLEWKYAVPVEEVEDRETQRIVYGM